MIAVQAGVIRDSLLECMQDFWKLDHETALAQSKRSLKEKASEVSSEICKGIIDVHPLRPIVKYALEDIVDHSSAVDVLGKNRTALLHVRHIEELFTVVKFLIAQGDRYNEFRWKWDNFEEIHRIRNTFTVDSLSGTGVQHTGPDHDPDGDSDGMVITISKT